MPELECHRGHTVNPCHILCLQVFWRRDLKTFVKFSGAYDLENSRTVWSVTPTCMDLCLLASQSVTIQPPQWGGGKQPKKLAFPFISSFFLTFVFIFESDTHYSKLLKGVRTFPHRRKWNWYAK